MKPIIEVNNLSKVYRLGTLGAKSFSDDIKGLYNKLLGRKTPLDPKVLEQMKTESNSGRINPERKNEFWALRDINFQIQPGEVVGIIGHNGAGKSTLLKILSRITEPTTGEITLRGRVSSLLEVGTGFHPELTGRENAYLNGAIHGMTRNDVDQLIPEIIKFAKMEEFIDTPVKRYSSGMYVRLAFAVAINIKTEILILDEILAVGDSHFQRKCMEKVLELQQQNKTVLMVSHNMSSILQSCSRVYVIQEGKICFEGKAEDAVQKYITYNNSKNGKVKVEDLKDHQVVGPNKFSRIMSVEILDNEKNTIESVGIGECLNIIISMYFYRKEVNTQIGCYIKNDKDIYCGGYISTWENFEKEFNKGQYVVNLFIPFVYLMPGNYRLSFFIKEDGKGVDCQVYDALSLVVYETKFGKTSLNIDYYKLFNVIHRGEWKIKSYES